MRQPRGGGPGRGVGLPGHGQAGAGQPAPRRPCAQPAGRHVPGAAPAGDDPAQPVRPHAQVGGEQVIGCPVHVPAQHQPGHVTRAKAHRPGIGAPGQRRDRARRAVHPAPATMEPLCTPLCGLAWVPAASGSPAGTHGMQACAACVALVLTPALHPWSGRPARAARGAGARRPAARELGYPAGAVVVPVMTRAGRRAWATSRVACQHSPHIGYDWPQQSWKDRIGLPAGAQFPEGHHDLGQHAEAGVSPAVAHLPPVRGGHDDLVVPGGWGLVVSHGRAAARPAGPC